MCKVMNATAIFGLLIVLGLSSFGADETVTGNLTVEGSLIIESDSTFGGNIDVQANNIGMGIAIGMPNVQGHIWQYAEDEENGQFSLSHIRSIASRDVARWSWTTVSEEKMFLDSTGLQILNQQSTGDDSVVTIGIGDERYLGSSGSVLQYGPGSVAEYAYSIALGQNSKARGNSENSSTSIAIGKGASAGLTASEAGITTWTNSSEWGAGSGGVAVGTSSFAGTDAVALGLNSRARSSGIAIGQAEAYGASGIAVGQHALANTNAISIGQWSGNNGNLASGSGSISIGHVSRAAADSAISLGQYTWAGGVNSIVLGNLSNTGQARSAALGYNAISLYPDQVTVGSFNDPGPGSSSTNADDPIFVVGNGTDDNNRSNALIVRRNGNTEIKGSLKVENQILRVQPAGGISMGEFTYDPDAQP